ncbi:tellurite resistance TerB family protein [Actinokineospora spheciospongiae]|uniref:hypothetical protein n=1 Tax=Actinokineospora spheciospongiae TaxID=909613 RepID=UPI000D716044|nr:hypothetical protein [Actinokineospora spheciospongiae]PWW62802.1 hypothetical protein DFQ13_105620 [Actinokineospora spheciospongiae]
MSDHEVLEISDFGKDAYGLSSAPAAAMVNYGKALLVIAGADGEVSRAELDWLRTHQRKFGATDEVIAEYETFDHRTADLAGILAGISTDVELTLHALIDMEKAVHNMRAAIFHVDVL